MSASACSSAIPQFGEGLVDLVSDHKTKEKAVAIAVESEVRGKSQRGAAGNVPRKHRAGIVRCIGKAEAVAVSQTAIHLRSQGEVLAAEKTLFRTCGQGQGA